MKQTVELLTFGETKLIMCSKLSYKMCQIKSPKEPEDVQNIQNAYFSVLFSVQTQDIFFYIGKTKTVSIFNLGQVLLV